MATSNTAQVGNVYIRWLRSIKLPYRGESRTWSFFFYPQAIFFLRQVDVVLLEGTTNLANNIYLIPIAKLFRKKIVWWDAGYSPPIRSERRKKIDLFASIFIGMTNKQIAYSTCAKQYLEMHMGALNCSLVLNTISTTYFNKVKKDVILSIQEHHLDIKNIKLLYVGAIEKRKKVIELISLVKKLSNSHRTFHLTIIGDGNYLGACKKFVQNNNIEHVVFTGRIYNKDKLKPYYFSSDLFVMPGDGGLALAQSLLFGLPAVCVAADGTELDYIDDKSYILDCFDQLEKFLDSFPASYDRKSVLSSMERLQDQHFISSLVEVLTP